ncbi:MAG: hypothetical protein FWE23_10745, partial [Chitinivibrionia bacterium]|nr:hypothetical protein [Chitinivibrionia bacterium]
PAERQRSASGAPAERQRSASGAPAERQRSASGAPAERQRSGFLLVNKNPLREFLTIGFFFSYIIKKSFAKYFCFVSNLTLNTEVGKYE